jgi:hypothetical protein
VVRSAALAAAALGLLAPGPARPQSTATAPGLLFPNQDRVLVGEVEALEGGAYVARAKGAASNWYNPAGLALTPTTTFSLSSGGWEYQLLSASQFVTSDVSQSIGSRPSFAGFVFAKPLVNWEDLRLGLSVTNFASLRPNLDATASRQVAAGMEDVGYATQSQLSEYRVAVGAGYRISDTFRVGGSLNVNYLYMQRNETVSDRLTGEASTALSLQTQVLSGRGVNLGISAGAQWDPLPGLSLGLLVVTPGLHVYGYSSVTYQSQAVDHGTTVVADIRDKRATYEYYLPLQVNAGVAWTADVVAVELDVRYHTAQKAYTVASTQEPVRATVLYPDGSTMVRYLMAPEYTAAQKAVVNVAVGGRVVLGPTVTLHAGFFTDFSPVAPSENPLFQAVDLYGVTAGASLRWEHFSGSVGGAYTWGHSGDLEFKGLLGGPAFLGSIDAKIISLLLAISYRT